MVPARRGSGEAILVAFWVREGFGAWCVGFDEALWRALWMGADERAHEARWREGFGLERQRSVSRPRAASSSAVGAGAAREELMEEQAHP